MTTTRDQTSEAVSEFAGVDLGSTTEMEEPHFSVDALAERRKAEDSNLYSRTTMFLMANSVMVAGASFATSNPSLQLVIAVSGLAMTLLWAHLSWRTYIATRWLARRIHEAGGLSGEKGRIDKALTAYVNAKTVRATQLIAIGLPWLFVLAWLAGIAVGIATHNKWI